MQSGKKQSIVGLSLLVLSLFLAGFLFFRGRVDASIAWLVGMSFGYVFQRSRFCTVAAVRDIFLFKNFALAKGVLLYMTLTTISYSVLYILAQENIIVISDYLASLSILTPLGAVIFGVGMVIAGGCAAGTLIRMGEGLIMQWWAFLGLIAGLLAATWAFPFYEKYTNSGIEVYIPNYIGLYPTLAIQLGIFLSVYLIFKHIEKKNKVEDAGDFFIVSKKFPDTKVQAGVAEVEDNKSALAKSLAQLRESLAKGLTKIFARPWSYQAGAIVLAIISTFVFVWQKFWGISTGLMHLFAGITNYFYDMTTWLYFANRIDQGKAVFFDYSLVPLVIAMVVGSHISSLLAREFRIRKVANSRYLWSAIIGGLMMGIGARLANGCNVGTVMSAIPSFSLNGWVFLIFMILGVLVGIELVKRYLV